MILMVSGRTDIVAFYTKWFMNRYKAGFVDVRNPINLHLISRINFSNVDLIMFCTKNPLPIIPYLHTIKEPIIFHVTLTPYNKDIEPNVPSKVKIMEGIKEISNIIGADNTFVRYDPILLNDKYTTNYHKKAFTKLCESLDGYVKHIIVSFVDDYKNVKHNQKYLKLISFKDSDYKEIGESFSKIASKHNMTVQTCFEDNNLIEYGFIKGECLSPIDAYKLTGKIYKEQTIRKGGNCHCISMVDIGAYNTCPHRCRYCYANFDESKISENIKKHHPDSSLLIGEINYDDIIKERYK